MSPFDRFPNRPERATPCPVDTYLADRLIPTQREHVLFSLHVPNELYGQGAKTMRQAMTDVCAWLKATYGERWIETTTAVIERTIHCPLLIPLSPPTERAMSPEHELPPEYTPLILPLANCLDAQRDAFAFVMGVPASAMPHEYAPGSEHAKAIIRYLAGERMTPDEIRGRLIGFLRYRPKGL